MAESVLEKEPITTKPLVKESDITVPTSEEEFYTQAAQNIATHATAAGHPTTPETVKGNKVLPITPEMENIGAEPTGSDIPINVVKMVKEDVFGAPESTHRVGYGESGHGLYNIIERVKGKSKLKNQNLKKAA